MSATEPDPTATPLTLPNYAIMDTDAIMRQYLELRLRALMTEVNWIRAQLGKNPKRCHNCGALTK